MLRKAGNQPTPDLNRNTITGASAAGLRLIEELQRLEILVDELATKLELLEDRVAKLDLPAANPLTVVEVAAKYPAYSVASLRWLLFNRRENGLDGAVLRRGRRVLIDERKFLEWIAESREASARMIKRPQRN